MRVQSFPSSPHPIATKTEIPLEREFKSAKVSDSFTGQSAEFTVSGDIQTLPERKMTQIQAILSLA
jgi:hypothetical protein